MPYSILVIDDEEPIRQSLSLLLRIKGYMVMAAGDGRLGLEAIERSSPDLVITDIIMPGAEGIETILAIKARNPLTKIIAMSGGARVNGRDFLELAQEMGADACVEKPFETDQLLGTIASCLGVRE